MLSCSPPSPSVHFHCIRQHPRHTPCAQPEPHLQRIPPEKIHSALQYRVPLWSPHPAKIRFGLQYGSFFPLIHTGIPPQASVFPIAVPPFHCIRSLQAPDCPPCQGHTHPCSNCKAYLKQPQWNSPHFSSPWVQGQKLSSHSWPL